MKRLWFKTKEIWWKFILGAIIAVSLVVYFYRLLRPVEDKLGYLEIIKTETTAALKESELRGRLEKDKIGIIKASFESRLADTSRIEDREERLRSLIRLHKELDI